MTYINNGFLLKFLHHTLRSVFLSCWSLRIIAWLWFYYSAPQLTLHCNCQRVNVMPRLCTCLRDNVASLDFTSFWQESRPRALQFRPKPSNQTARHVFRLTDTLNPNVFTHTPAFPLLILSKSWNNVASSSFCSLSISITSRILTSHIFLKTFSSLLRTLAATSSACSSLRFSSSFSLWSTHPLDHP